MKCKKCGTTMVYTKEGEHNYNFTCPKCHTVSRTKVRENGK